MFDFQSGIRDLSFEDDTNDIFDEYLSCSESDDEAKDRIDLNAFDSYESDNESDAGSYSEIDDEIDLNYPEEEDDNFNFMFGFTLAKALVLWAVKFGISHNALTELLKILKKFGHNELPNLARTLLRTPRKAVKPRLCGTGEFHYRGIRFNVLNYNRDFLYETDTIEFDFFIDGLSLSESSKVKMWPIMGSFAHHPTLRPFVVGCYSGTSDPVNVDDFMKEFVEEIKFLQQNGIEVTKNRVVKNFKFRCFVADAPARALASGTVGHASYFGCPKCNQVCCSEGHKLYYQFFIGELRTDESFRRRDDILHHKPEFQHKASLLEGVIGMVSQIVIEAMHAVDLGITKRICKAIISNQVSCCKITKIAFAALQSRFKSFRSFVPSEFARKPRCLNELGGFKATEFRQMLLYTLPVLLKHIVSPQLHKQIVNLHVAIRLLSDPIRYKENIEAARKLITDFVNDYDETFGKKNFTYYTHCLLHLPDYVVLYGPLYSTSAYKYENHIRLIKRLLRRKHGHIKQFFNRVDEMSFADEIADELELNDHNKEPKFNEFNLEAGSLRDGCCMVEPGYPLVITEVFVRNGVKMVRGNRFLTCRDFYDEPLPSMENMGTILASNLSETLYAFPATAITHKFFRSTMERLVVNKWVKPKCAGNAAYTTTFANKTPSAISLKTNAISKPTPHFRLGSLSVPTEKSPRSLAHSKIKVRSAVSQTSTKKSSGSVAHSTFYAHTAQPKVVSFNGPSATYPTKKKKSLSNFKCKERSNARTLPNEKLSIHTGQKVGYNFNNATLSLDKNQVVPLPSSWKSPGELSNAFGVTTKISSIQTHKEGINVISSVTISENHDETKQSAYSLSTNQPLKLSLFIGKPWTTFTQARITNPASSLCVNNGTRQTGINGVVNKESLNSIQSQVTARQIKRSADTSSKIVGKKVLLTTEMLKRLVPLPSNFKLSPSASTVLTNIESNDFGKMQRVSMPTTLPAVNINSDGGAHSSIQDSDVPHININFDAGGNSSIHHSDDATYAQESGMSIQSKIQSVWTSKIKRKDNGESSRSLLIGDEDNTTQSVSLEEFNKLKRRETRNSSVIKAIVRKLKGEDFEVESFSFPLDDMLEFEKFSACLKKPRFNNKLIKSLEKKILKSIDVVSDLVETIFTPKLLFKFNVNGYNKFNFKKTKINEIFFGLSKMDHEKYYVELTKVIHKLHTRHRRS